MSVPNGVMGRSVVFDRGISKSFVPSLSNFLLLFSFVIACMYKSGTFSRRIHLSRDM